MTLRFHCLGEFIGELRKRGAGDVVAALDLRVDIDRSRKGVIVTARISSLKDTVLRFEMLEEEARYLTGLRTQIEDTLRSQGWTVRPGVWEV